MAQKFFIVDVEAWGASPIGGKMTEFGVVEVASEAWFHGVIYDAKPSAENPACPDPATAVWRPRYECTLPEAPSTVTVAKSVPFGREKFVYDQFLSWVERVANGDDPRMFSDNPAYDYMWLTGSLDDWELTNPFGHTARRIGDLYAGFTGNWKRTTDWKKLRVTPHTHNPVDDAKGNAEALKAILFHYNPGGLPAEMTVA